MSSEGIEGHAERRIAVLGGAGILLIAVALASDFVVGSFWSRHTMLTSLLAGLLVVLISGAVVNEVLERRHRRRWSLLAQSVLFALVQSARLTWTALLEVLRLMEVRSGAVESLREGSVLALDRERVSAAARELLAEPERRQELQRMVERLSEHANEVIANWATVMVGAAPYAKVLDRHVELQVRLDWLSAVLAHHEPAPDAGTRSRRMTQASIATEQADQLDDEWVHDMVVSITALAAHLDYDSRELAFSLVPTDWWEARTQALAET